MDLGIVAALGAALGVGLGGYGIFKGSTDAGRAADRVAIGTEETLRTVREEMIQMRTFMTETVWPEVNKTIVHFRNVLDRADVILKQFSHVLDRVAVLLDTSTFMVKGMALVFAICAA